MRLAGGAAAQSCGGTADIASLTRGSAGGTSARANEPLHAAAEAALRDAPPDAVAGTGYDPAATAAAAVHFALFGAPSSAPNAAQPPLAPLAETQESMDAYMRACAARLGRLEAETAAALQMAREAQARCSLLQEQHAALARLITAHAAADGEQALLQPGLRAAASAEEERAAAGAAPAEAAAHPHAASWLSASSGEASADESDMSEPGADSRMPDAGDGAAAASTHAADSDGSCSSGAGAASA
jgi:hypothetical protein